ncbi:MAG: 5'-3' exonuclease H3TH domain-containing protein [bacterium]
MTKLLLVDGSAILHRAYHAYPPLTSPDGTIVGAVYGVASILLTVIDSQQPTHIVVAWDLPKPTFRHEKYVGYKAQRPKADAELVDQISIVKELLSAMGMTQIAQEGYEGDDIIGSLAKQLGEVAEETLILTGDQDTMQLVTERVSVMLPAKGKDPVTLYGPEQVLTRYGIHPSQVVDYKALVGDSSDNIPGVAGIGPKTAAGLIVKYQDLDGIYTHLTEIGETVRTKLIEGRDSAYLSQDLSRIVTEMNLAITLNDLVISDFKNEKLQDFLLSLGFKSLVKRIFGHDIKKEIISNQTSLF